MSVASAALNTTALPPALTMVWIPVPLKRNSSPPLFTVALTEEPPAPTDSTLPPSIVVKLTKPPDDTTSKPPPDSVVLTALPPPSTTNSSPLPMVKPVLVTPDDRVEVVIACTLPQCPAAPGWPGGGRRKTAAARRSPTPPTRRGSSGLGWTSRAPNAAPPVSRRRHPIADHPSWHAARAA